MKCLESPAFHFQVSKQEELNTILYADDLAVLADKKRTFVIP